MSLDFSTRKMLFEGKELNLAIMEMENAVFLFLWEGVKPYLGTLTVALPSRVSSQLLGDRNVVLGQVLGEQLAAFFKRMVLISVHLKTVKGEAVGRKVLELTREMLGTRDCREV